jgi:PKD repeat protein
MTRYIRFLVGAVLCIFFVTQLNAQQINYAEYFFDNDPGRGNGISLSITTTNTIDASFSISTASLSGGMHHLYIRTRSNTGKWSMNGVSLVYINPVYNTTLSKIVAAEYFVNSDPGQGNGNAIAITNGDTISTLKSIPTSSLPTGIHTIFIRVKNGYGQWSLAQKGILYITNNHQIGQLVAAEYFFDNDPGFGNANALTVTTGNTIDLNTTISTSTLTSGLHYLNARAKDSNGKWSLKSQILFYISRPVSSRNLTEAEYFFDNDPGFGNGISISITPDDSVNLSTAINTAGLTSGLHFFNIRMKDVSGKWSLSDRQLIYLLAGNLSSPRIVEAEYFFDADPGKGNGTNFNFSAGNTIDVSAAIASSALTMGHHQFTVRVKDSLDRWSLNDRKLVFVSAAQTTQKIVAIEYSVDTIMPFGLGNMVNFSPYDTLDYTFTFNHGIIDTFYHALYLRVKDAGGRWSMIDSMHFRLENCIIPTATFNFADLCFGDSLILYNSSLATDTSSIFAWDLGNDGLVESTDSTSYTFMPLTPGAYKISLKVTNFVCIDTMIGHIQVFPKPDNSISVFGNTTFCPGSFSVLAANAGVGYQYNWLKNGNLINNANASFYQANDSGDYRAVVKNIYNCTDTTSTISLGIYDLPQATISLSGSSSICSGDSVQLTSPLQAGIDYQWYFNGDTIQNANLNTIWVKATGDYKVKITNSNGCTDISSAQSIVVNPVPTATIQAGGNTVFCSGQNVVLYGSNGIGYSYQWMKNGALLNGATTSFISATQSGNYIVKITNAYNCADTSDATQITSNPSPVATVNLFGSNTICQGDTVSLHGPSDVSLSYQWNSYGTPISGATDSVISVNQTGNYTLVATNSNNCSTTSLGTVITVNPVPGASILPLGSTSFCDGDSVLLQANAGSGLSYNWFKSGNPISAANGSQFTADTNGTYTVEVTNSFNCSTESQAISVTSFPIPSANFYLPATNCASDTITVQYLGSASSSAFYNWNFGGGTIIGGNGQGPYQIVFNQAGIKSLSLSVSENGCISTPSSQNTNILSVPSFITAPITSVCQGDSVLLTANSGSTYTYQWFQGGLAIANETQASIVVMNSGSYQVKVTNSQLGCTKLSMAVPVQVNTTDFNLAFASSITNFTQPPFSIAITNQTPNLNNYNFLWELGDGNTSSFFNPLHTYQYNGTYTVKLYAENVSTGCKDTLIKANYISCTGGSSNPCNIIASINPTGPATICKGDSILLQASAGTGYTYQWFHNNTMIVGATNQNYTAKNVGNYRIVVSDNQCSQTSPAFVLNQYPSIQPVIQSTGIIQPCTTDSMQLSLLVNYNQYNWNTGATTSSIYVKQTGYYQVAVSDNFGCNLTSQPFVVSSSYLNPPSICIVGVDSANHNRLVWERQNNALIDSFYVYKEGFITGQYDKIGALDFDTTSLFVDINSNPAIKAYKYKIAAVDTCGGVSLLSDLHKTIHLTINAGLNGSWNLIWDGYQGFQFSTYRIYRGTNGNNLSLLTQLPSTATSYTDLNPPTGTVFYQIEVIKSTGCYPDTTVSKANTNYNTSRSNTANNGNIIPIYLTADFSANVVSGQWPIQVQFTDNSSGSPDQWNWDFGDGNNSIEQHPRHTYNNSGLYTVKLEACNGLTCDTIIRQDYIEVLPNGMIEIGVELAASLFPNPNDGNFTLEIFDRSNHQLQLHVYNTLGSEVYFEEFETQGKTSKQIKMNTLAKGIYYVHLNSDDRILYREKVILQ